MTETITVTITEATEEITVYLNEYTQPGGTGGGITDGDKGDITVSSGGATWMIDPQAVTFAKIQNIDGQSLIGRHSNGSGEAQKVTVNGGLEFHGVDIRRSALTGDVAAAAGSNTTTIANNAVTFAKMADISDESKLIGRGQGAFGGDPQEISLGANLVMTGTSLAVDAVEANTNSKIVLRSATGSIFVTSITATGGQSTFSDVVSTTLSATNTIELINGGTTAGPFRIYNTSSASNTNFERGFFKWDSNNFDIGCESSGTGTLRNVRIKTDATDGASGAGYIEFGGSNIINTIKSVGGTASGALYIYSQSALRMLIGGSNGITMYQSIVPNSTGANLNIGASGLRWRSVFCHSVDLTGDIVLPTATGTKIGTATNQLLGFFGATPVTQRAAISDATDAATTQARLNDLLAAMRALGLIAT